MRSVLRLLAALALLTFTRPALAQDSLNVTFRFIPGLTESPISVVRAFLPGSFNNWGPNSNGVIATNAPSQMSYEGALSEYRYTTRLRIGSTYTYKVHFHQNTAGTSYQWISDPLNPVTTGPNSDSQVQITDPMVFQLAREQRGGNTIRFVSASVFGTQNITALTFEVNGVVRDGMPHYNASTRLFRYELPQPVAPGSQFKITATDALGRTATATVGTIPPTVTDAPRPAGIRDGINYHPSDPTKVTLSLFAPYKRYVYVIGEFNNWQASAQYLMKRDSIRADSVHYWLEITGLTPGQEVAYQYLVDGLIRTADPYAPKVLDPFSDNEIRTSGTHPNLKAYPAGASGVVGIMQPGAPAYSWQVNDWQRPPQGELVIYELLIRDFIAKHDFATLIDTLDYLDRLGINAIQLMPVQEFDGNRSWGYNPAFYFAVDKFYGPARDLKRFVDEAHRRGIAVILDVVYNHATGQNPIIRLWNTSPTGDPSGVPTAQNPYANTTARHPFNVFNDLNHESTATKYLLDRLNRYWLEEFRVDGFRYDLSKGFTQRQTTDVGVWSAYDASRIALLKRMADRVWEVDPRAYVILEHFAENREEQELVTYGVAEGKPGMMTWTNLNHAYNEATMGYNNSSNFSAAYYGVGGRGFSVPNSIAYMESHDEQWLMFKNRAYGACANFPAGGNGCNTNPGAYNVRDLATALDRMKTAGAFFFTLPGPKMMWQFGELGYGGGPGECLFNDGSECPAGTPGRVSDKPIRWEYRANPDRYRLYRTWSALLNLREQQPVFRSAQTQANLSLSGAVKRIKLSHPTLDVVIVGNFGVTPLEATPAFHRTGTWYDYFEGRAVEVTDVNATLSLKPGQFRLFTSAHVGYAEPGLTVGVEAIPGGELPTEVALAPNAPNPFRETTQIRYDVPNAGPVVLEVYDVLGRRVATLVDAVQSAGRYIATLDGDGLASGTYVYRLTAGGQTLTRTLTLVR